MPSTNIEKRNNSPEVASVEGFPAIRKMALLLNEFIWMVGKMNELDSSLFQEEHIYI